MVKESSISKAQSYEEMAKFWNTHSTADFEDDTYEVELTFDPSARQTWVMIEPDLFTELRQIAQTRRVSLQTLVNVWLSQRVSEAKIQLS
ncbi:CopG family antitoxin [Anaerolineales bacterium HSG24]|nr:CopG family antitoxin [Anaerolineales bacterium HSG24]